MRLNYIYDDLFSYWICTTKTNDYHIELDDKISRENYDEVDEVQRFKELEKQKKSYKK